MSHEQHSFETEYRDADGFLTTPIGRVEEWQRQLTRARAGEGETLFDILVGIVRGHGPEGVEAEDGVELVLE